MTSITPTMHHVLLSFHFFLLINFNFIVAYRKDLQTLLFGNVCRYPLKLTFLLLFNRAGALDTDHFLKIAGCIRVVSHGNCFQFILLTVIGPQLVSMFLSKSFQAFIRLPDWYFHFKTCLDDNPHMFVNPTLITTVDLKW